MLAIHEMPHGKADEMRWCETPIPTPGDHELLVRVHAAGVNRLDILQRQGLYPPPPGDSDILGLEIAGTVISWGKKVTGFEIGDRVCGLVGGGGYAEYAVLDKKMALSIPQHWSYAEAAALPESFLTAHETVFELGKLKSGGALLIHAAGSALGVASLQLAKAADAQVFVTAGQAPKRERLLELGADAAWSYEEDFVAALHVYRAEGVSVVQDVLGGDMTMRNLASLKTRGCLVQVAFLRGKTTTLDLAFLQRHRLQIKGMALRHRSLAEKRQAMARFKKRWWKLCEEGFITPMVDRTYPYTEVIQAHQCLEARENFGKVVLTWPN